MLSDCLLPSPSRVLLFHFAQTVVEVPSDALSSPRPAWAAPSQEETLIDRSLISRSALRADPPEQ